MGRSRVLALLALSSLLFPILPRPAWAAQKTEAGSPSAQAVERAIKRITGELGLEVEQVEKVRETLYRHSQKLAQLWNRQQAQPYSPQVQTDIEEETKAIRDEVAGFLTEDQKSKLPGANMRPIPGPPGFIPIGISPRDESYARLPPENLIRAVSNSKKAAAQLSDDQRILSLLNRITFGPRPGDVQAVKQMGIAAYMDQQLHPETIDDSAVQKRLKALPTIDMDAAELYSLYPQPNVAMDRMKDKKAPPVYGRPQQLIEELSQQKLVRAVDSKRQLQEVMTDFWFNHFNVFAQKGADLYLLTGYERDVIRPNALGKFHDLLLAVAQSPAMLFYLDNWLSAASDAARPRPPALPAPGNPQAKPQPQPAAKTVAAVAHPQGSAAATNPPSGAAVPTTAPQSAPPKAAPVNQPKPAPPRGPGINENFGRELMELHTLGVNGGYTQKDVQEVSRCLTGWTLDQPYQNPSFAFKPWMHDEGSKTVLGTEIPGGGGISDGLRVIDILCHHPSTARFIAQELCQRFVSDDPPRKLVDRVAQVFLTTDGDIREVLGAIFTSPEINSSAVFRSKVKSPLELAASAIRALDGDTDGGPAIQEWIGRMGEPLYQYMAPTGYGEASSRWMNSGVFLDRLNFLVGIANNQIRGTSYDPQRLVPLDAAGNTDRLTGALTALIVHTELSAESRHALEVGLSTDPASNRTQADLRTAPEMKSEDSLSGGRREVEVVAAKYAPNQERQRITQTVELLFGTSEFQRR